MNQKILRYYLNNNLNYIDMPKYCTLVLNVIATKSHNLILKHY